MSDKITDVLKVHLVFCTSTWKQTNKWARL